jgi:Fe-S-cluster containining protein
MPEIPYIVQCANCGECCRTPGLFLPEQMEAFAAHFGIGLREVFDRYLIAQLWMPSDIFRSPSDCVTPVLVLAPVKADGAGKRAPQRCCDQSYMQMGDLHCIFRDNEGKKCTIYSVRPFECSLSACSYMTKDSPMSLGRRYYYHKWKDWQDPVLSIFPEIRPLYEKLEQSAREMRESFEMRNQAMYEDIATALNGYPHEVPICI